MSERRAALDLLRCQHERLRASLDGTVFIAAHRSGRAIDHQSLARDLGRMSVDVAALCVEVRELRAIVRRLTAAARVPQFWE